ncbi:GH3 auxin-responsive promoter family protein [Acetobacterium wieringae]|uniref:GH3 auxin-responsive promoter family protein n=1 Tax=Acetobacterium wieringae TaxID=52694 RepID=UPI002B21727F|nr:GH3 auxin-responsive promoter family protein [Acetobacterium wieringae]MEA4806584.1 GH3 auxin-responsive promoter family protein [Acetobacterium wieringae]
MTADKISEGIPNDSFDACWDERIPEHLKGMSNEHLIKSFYMMEKTPEVTQLRVLQDILKSAQNTEFGKKMGFSEIKTIDDFRNRVPFSDYAQVEGEIERLKAGAHDVFFDGAAASFIATSGSTGIPKLLPESKNGELVKGLVSQIRAIILLMLAPEVMVPGKKVLAIANPSEYGKTEGGIPIGSASGQAAKDMPVEMLKKMVLPPEMMLAKDLSNEATDYLTIRYALAEKHLVGVVCSNIAHFNILLKKMNATAADLLEDISTGQISEKISIDQALREKLVAHLQPNPERAEELRTILAQKKTLDVAEIWPEFSVVSCWMSSSAAKIVADVKKILPPTVKFLEWGYGASEGKFNIPDRPQDAAGLLALFGYFFEFLPVGSTDGKTRLAHELTEGDYYELIITSYSGLYRYNMKDIVCVTEINDQIPRIVFVCKESEYLAIENQKMRIYEIERTLQTVAAKQNEEIRFYQIFWDQDNKKLVFILEPYSNTLNSEVFKQVLENHLFEMNFCYKQLREAYQLLAAEVILVKDGYRDSLFTRSIMPGKNVNQTKLPTFVKKYPESDWITCWAKEGEK